MTSNDHARKIKCFQHCDKGINILCFHLPSVCPLCRRDIYSTESRVPPYLIPSPFSSAHSCPICIIIKPTNGTFLKDYTNRSNLHIGLTSSQGIPYDYDEDGVNINGPNWEDCLAIDLRLLVPGGWWQHWDDVLQGFSLSNHWSKHRYHEDQYNCFDFVINILWHLNLDKIHSGLSSKLSLCEDIILPYSKKAAKYISYYREIQEKGFVCQPCQY